MAGREKLHHLNAEPINAIARRWIHRYDRDRVEALADLKSTLEEPVDTTFVYTAYVNTAPRTALARAHRAGVHPPLLGSDWRVGSTGAAAVRTGEPAKDHGQVVLESDPHRRLAHTWHNCQPEHAELFGWSAETFAELRREPVTRVAFDLAELDGRVRLTVTHEGFAGETEMYRAVSGKLEQSGGWSQLMSDLKSLLESELVS